jgi:hypothetical protein
MALGGRLWHDGALFRPRHLIPMRSSDETAPRAARAVVVLTALWGVGGVALLLLRALARLTPLALEPWRNGALLWWQAALYVAWVAINAHAEGYRGFQKQFIPRVIRRALELVDGPAPRTRDVVLAPAYCMSLIAAPRRDLIRSWAILIAIIIAVAAVRALPQPWRGIIDAGVVVGLAWGLVAMCVQFAQVFPRLLSAPAARPPTRSPG